MAILKWITQAQVAGALRGKRKNLALIVQQVGKKWMAAGLETKAKTVEGALDAHAHALIGNDFSTLFDAMSACEEYARKWNTAESRGQSTSDLCDCGPIAGKKKARRKASA